jgi:hypothetical protein
MDIILKEKKKGEGGQQREQKLLQQRKRVASPRVCVFPVGLVYYLFVVCVVLSCIENNNASRGQTILGYSPGLLYSKCPCLVLLPISCRPRSTTADMTSSTQLSVRFFPPPQDRGSSRPPIERSTYVCQTAILAKIGIWTSQSSVRPSFFFFYSFFFSFLVYYYLLFPFGFMLPRTTFPISFFCVRVSLPCLVYAKWGRLEKKIVPWTTHKQLLRMHIEWTNEPNNFIWQGIQTLQLHAHVWAQEGRLAASILTITSLYYTTNCS